MSSLASIDEHAERLSGLPAERCVNASHQDDKMQSMRAALVVARRGYCTASDEFVPVEGSSLICMGRGPRLSSRTNTRRVSTDNSLNTAHSRKHPCHLQALLLYQAGS